MTTDRMKSEFFKRMKWKLPRTSYISLANHKSNASTPLRWHKYAKWFISMSRVHNTQINDCQINHRHLSMSSPKTLRVSVCIRVNEYCASGWHDHQPVVQFQSNCRWQSRPQMCLSSTVMYSCLLHRSNQCKLFMQPKHNQTKNRLAWLSFNHISFAIYIQFTSVVLKIENKLQICR